MLRWLIQRGVVVIPKTVSPARMAQNLDVFDFELTAEELAAISALDRPDPEMLDSDVFGH